MANPTNITSPFDIYGEINGWFPGNWSTVINTINQALQLPATNTSLEVNGAVGTETSTEIKITYGQISFMNVDLVISSLIIDITNKILTLTAAPIVTAGQSNWNLTQSLPAVSGFELLDGLIQNPEFTFTLSVDDKGNPDCTLSFKCIISTSGSGLSSEASKFIGFFGNTGMAQLFLHYFNGGFIPSVGIQLTGTIDLTSPIKTERCGDVPNIQLSASLTGSDDSFTLFSFLKVKNPRLSFKTVASETSKTQTTPLFASIEPSFEMDLIVGEGDNAVDIVFSCGAPPELGSITLTAASSNSGISLEDVFSLMNGNNWEGMIPGPLQAALNEIDFKSISANISLPGSYSSESKFELNWITVNVNSNPNNQIKLFGPFQDITFSVVWSIFNPLEREKMYSLINFNAGAECIISSETIGLQLSISG